MYLNNVIKFTRGGSTERPELREYILIWLLPLVLAIGAFLHGDNLRQTVDHEWRYYQICVVTAIAVYVIVTLRITYCMSLRDYMRLYCVSFIFAIYFNSAITFADIVALGNFHWCILPIYFLPIIIVSLLAAWSNYVYLKKKKQRTLFLNYRVGRIAIIGSSGGHFSSRSDSSYTEMFVWSVIFMCILSAFLALFLQRLYFTEKYKISWKTVDGIENSLH